MSSGFVPAGSDEARPRSDDDWLKAQQAIEATRRQKQEEGKQEGGKSLYEVLQQNKTAKQEEFEEKARLRNQFRSLDDDEADFLDSILESTRAKEAQVKRETAEQLDAFRKQRQAAEEALVEGKAVTESGKTQARSPGREDTWAMSTRKRRRIKEKDDGIPKLRKKLSTAADDLPPKLSADSGISRPATSGRGNLQTTSNDKNGTCTATAPPKLADVIPPRPSVPSTQISPPTLGLGAYSSDEE